MSLEDEFHIFWKHYGVSYAEQDHVEEAKQAFIVAIERQIATAIKEQLCES